jgi:rubrerythrin
MNLQEAYRIAIEAEIRSQNLYKALAKSFKTIESASIFNQLLMYEINHEEKMRAYFIELFPNTPLQLMDDLSMELKGLNLSDPKNILEFAISREELAQNIYLKIAEQTPAGEVKDTLLSFANEELHHKEILFKELERMHGIVDWYDPSELNGLMED